MPLSPSGRNIPHSTDPDMFTKQGPDTPLQTVAIISGPSKLPSCGDIRIDSRRSMGSGGRQMGVYLVGYWYRNHGILRICAK